jgi:predicted dehydrogenase
MEKIKIGDAAKIGIVGTGFVADLYMRSLKTFPGITVVKAFDTNVVRLTAFSAYWNVPAASSLQDLLSGANAPNLILNLTNPDSHFQVSHACLNAGKHVYSEKPLASSMKEAIGLYETSKSRSLMLASAPCSILGEAAQTLWLAVRRNVVGQVRLVYAELDDDFVSQAPYKKWKSESGAPWPYRDEFQTGCTVEHAGYYLTWLITMFGSVEKVVAASASLIQDKLGNYEPMAPDFSSAVLFFKSGIVARLTCSIVAPHNHGLKVIGDGGILEVGRSWDNNAPVRVRRRFNIRRKLVNSPFASRYRIAGQTHPKVKRWGAAAMNFALGPAEMISAISESRPCRLSAESALHLNEVTLAIQEGAGVHFMQTTCPQITPMNWAK